LTTFGVTALSERLVLNNIVDMFFTLRFNPQDPEGVKPDVPDGGAEVRGGTHRGTV
jgi:hypothetical protein